MTTNKYQICTRCVMDTSDPDITFDENGVCYLCTEFLENRSSRLLNNPQGAIELEKIVAKIKKGGENRDYDCVVGVSGGVDSSYVLYLAKKHGLRPLAVHLDNGWDSEIAVQNIKNLCKKLDVDYESYVLDWLEFRDIQLSILKSGIVEVEIPTDIAIAGSLHRVAAEHGIKYLISGGNIATEGILPQKWFYNPTDRKLLKHIQNKFGKVKMKTFPTFGLFEGFYYRLVKGIKSIYILNYIDYDKDEAMSFLKEELDWKYYGGKHYESKFTGFVQSYLQPVKFDVDYRRATCSTQICVGTMTRDEALEILSKPSYNQETVDKEKEFIAKKFDISLNEFNDIIDASAKSYKDYPNNEKLTDFVHKVYRKIFPNGRQ